MSYSTHHRSGDEACRPGARGSGVCAHTGRHAGNRIPGLRRAGPQGHGGVFVAVPELAPPDPRFHHDQRSWQPVTAWTGCR